MNASTELPELTETVRGLLGSLARLALKEVVFAGTYGVAIMLLWRWFVVPFFHVPPLPFAYAVGLKLLFLALRGPVVPDEEGDDSAKALALRIAVYLWPAYLVAIAWCVKAVLL